MAGNYVSEFGLLLLRYRVSSSGAVVPDWRDSAVVTSLSISDISFYADWIVDRDCL